jgi:microsomal dipeptidase-like Zn-dependent dipeptidase
MIADLHAHYPMHLVPEDKGSAIDAITTARGRRRLRDVIRAWLVGIASRFGNYRTFESGPRVTVDSMTAGGVGVAWSVLYAFFDEVDLSKPYAAPPAPDYVTDVLSQMDTVDENIAQKHADKAVVTRNPAELEAALSARKLALVHVLEGGFHLGATPEEVARDGVIGLIFAQHQLLDGLTPGKTKTFEESFEAICKHIDRIAEITGSYGHIGLGTDFDGFIKPTLGGLESSADLAQLETALRAKYGDENADSITSGNALRLLRGYWRGAPAPA